MREDLLKSAVSFLTSPNVQSADREKKIQFLKKKGLDDEEIEEAFKRAGSTPNTTTTTTTTTTNAVKPVVNNTPSIPTRPTTVYQLPPKIIYYPPPGPVRLTTKQLVGWIVVLGLGAFGVTSAVTIMIKQCMKRVFNKIGAYQGARYRNYTTLTSKVKASLEENTIQKDEGATTLTLLDTCVQEQKHLTDRLDKLTLKLKSSDLTSDDRCTELKTTLEDFRSAVLRHPTLDMQSTFSNDYYSGSNGGLTSSYANRYRNDNSNNTAIQSIKSEIRSIKGALLSRRNFPTANLPTINPTITTTASTVANVVKPSTPTNTTTPTTPTTATTATTATTTTTTNTTTDPSSQPGYHPRNRRSYRSELASTATTVEEVKEDEAK
ncbi:hypothetical protein K501DRAFT_336891 [Backusella circina FSU 941]|nr:hypothetical protein K501DRAFT_336891 [Backusella circina FSU 941]